jgi:hypothetical protein
MQAFVPRLSDLVEGENVESFFRENPQEEIQYYHRDMCYIFDAKNDAQRSYRKILQNEMCYKNFYIAAYQEENIPSHRFPSTQDISCRTSVIRYTHRINNRMSWIYEKNEDENWITYLRYSHAPNVEMNTMQHDLERAIARMPKPPQKGNK